MVPPRDHPGWVTANTLVASGTVAHGDIVVIACAVFDAMLNSCPAPVPAKIRTNKPVYPFIGISKVELPIVVAEN